MKTRIPIVLTAMVSSFCIQTSAFAFEGRIGAVITQGGQTTPLLYTAGTNFLRIEVTATDRPHPVDIVDLNSGELTLLFPHNRSFVRLKPAAENSSAMPAGFPPPPGGFPPGAGLQRQPPGAPAMPNMSPPPNPPPGLPPGIGPTNLPGMPAMPPAPTGLPPGVGPQAQPSTKPIASAMPAMPNLPPGGGMPAMPAMPMMPPPMMEKMELKATGDKTNLLGFVCARYEINQRGETMEIWATDQLFPFQPYVQNQPHRFGPRMIEEQWGDLLKAKKLFPLLAILRFERPSAVGAGALPSAGPERYRFEVKAVTPEKITDETLFQPPTNYFEIQPLPF